MKICPLVTQAYILDDSKNEVLVREADDNVQPAGNSETPGSDGSDEIFLNPGTPAAEVVEEEGPVDETGGKSVRITAKSFRGEVECLGGLCRFHDAEIGSCRFDALLSGESGMNGGIGEELQSLKTDLDKSWDFQKRSTSDMLGFFREIQEKNEKAQEDIRMAVEGRISELKDLFSSISDENKVIIESIADTLAEKSEELEERMKSSDAKIDGVKSEMSNWKGSLDRNIETIETDLGENRKLIEELSENNSEVMKVVENQKESLQQEEKKRMLAEARRLNNAGVMNYHNGQYEKALDMFGKAIGIDVNFTEAYNNIGLTYTEMNDEDKATEAFKKAIELKPELGATYNNLGYVFYRMGSYHEAIEMYNEAIGRSKDNSSAWTNLGNAYYKLDKIEEALDSWNKALEIDPGNEKAKRNLKRFHAEAGNRH